MKRCPRCHQTFTDETLKFCRDDGAFLQSNNLPAESSDTLILPAARSSDAPSTRLLQNYTGRAEETGSPLPSVKSPQTGELKAAGDIHSPSSAEHIAQAVKKHKGGIAIASVVLLSAVVGFGYWLFFHRTASVKQIESIAVMPFENTSSDPNVEYLSDGVAESLINSLTQLQQLKVISRSTAFRYKSREVDPQVVGRELNVQAVLMGKVHQIGDRLNIQVDLVDAETGAQLWGEEYERPVSDVLLIKQAIAREVTEKLRLRLSGQQQQQLARRETSNPEAYQFYLRGRHFWNKRTADGIRKAIEQFQQAVESDPNYALGYVGLADSYMILEEYAGVPESETLPKAKAAVNRALQIDDSLAEAHTSLANINQKQWLWAEAEQGFRRAISLNPNYPTAHHWFSVYFRARRQFDEALKESKLGQALDPLSLSISNSLANVYLHKNDINSAIQQCERIIELDPNYPAAHANLGSAYLKQGRDEEAIAEFQKAVELSGRATRYLGDLGYGLAVTGRRGKALQILRELEERYAKREALGLYLAKVYAGLGDKDQVFEWLEKDFQQHSSYLPQVVWWYHFDDLRSDPRYADLVRRMGLEP